MSALTDIKGIGPVLAKACADKGYRSIKKIATAVVADLATVPGISEARAKMLVAAAKSLLANGPAAKASVAAKVTKADSGGKKNRTKKPTPRKIPTKVELSKKDKKRKKDKKGKKAKKFGSGDSH